MSLFTSRLVRVFSYGQHSLNNNYYMENYWVYASTSWLVLYPVQIIDFEAVEWCGGE